MGQVLHGCATTTKAIRRAIRRSEASLRALARRHGISATTVQKWRRRDTTGDARMGPKKVSSSMLTVEQEAMIVAFRRHTLLHRAYRQRCPVRPHRARRMQRRGQPDILDRPPEGAHRTLKDATVRRYHYGSHDDLRRHAQLFLDAYNHARRLKALRGLTPHEFICQTWTKEPHRFRIDPSHHTTGLNT